LKLTVLVNNNTTMRNLKAEDGLSLYIEDHGTKILFDTGCSALFLENAHKLGINLWATKYIVLSHGHYDHTWGLKHLLKLYDSSGMPTTKPILLTHPLSFRRRTKDNKELGCNVTEAELAESITVHKSNSPVWLTKQLVFLGEIKRKFSYEGNHTIGQIIKNGNVEADDTIDDDTALAYKSSQGIVIITGCSHSGICNIVEQAKEICHDDRILAIIGGFHLRKPSSEQLSSTIAYLKQANIKNLYACHCTDQPSCIALAQLGNLCEVTVGLTLQFPEEID
jgi:7,8-dihydropterin-6-yl-methyl-4-(beta-D-ribofuranosyl)aminobenzene 5'-phosphate synthase